MANVLLGKAFSEGLSFEQLVEVTNLIADKLGTEKLKPGFGDDLDNESKVVLRRTMTANAQRNLDKLDLFIALENDAFVLLPQSSVRIDPMSPTKVTKIKATKSDEAKVETDTEEAKADEAKTDTDDTKVVPITKGKTKVAKGGGSKQRQTKTKVVAKTKSTKSAANGKEKKPFPKAAFKDDAKITPLKKPEERAEKGTPKYDQYKLYKKGMTVGAFIKAGGKRSHLARDLKWGHVAVE